MEDFNYNRSKSHGNVQNMQMERYYEGTSSTTTTRPYDLRSQSASHAQSQRKGKSMTRSCISKSWSFADPEFQRKKRVASYKMYSVEGKVKGSFRKGFRWLKDRYWQVVYGFW